MASLSWSTSLLLTTVPENMTTQLVIGPGTRHKCIKVCHMIILSKNLNPKKNLYQNEIEILGEELRLSIEIRIVNILLNLSGFVSP